MVSIEHLVGRNWNPRPGAQKKYLIGDIYQCADLISYPSGYEGFGNAFLESVYYRKPIVVNRYSIYIADIEPKGFDTIAIEGFVGNKTIDKIFHVLSNEERRHEMIRTNYELGKRYFSYEVLERWLLHLIDVLEIQCTG